MRNKKHILRIAISALLVAISIIITRFFVFPPGATPFRLTLGNVPIILGGILFGPLYGGIIGFCADIIGANLIPSGTFLVFPFISSILYGVIPGLVFMLLRRIRTKTQFPFVYPLVVILFVFVVVYFATLKEIAYPFSFNNDAVWVLDPVSKVVTILIAALVMAGLLVGLYMVEKKIKRRDSFKKVLPSDFALTIIVTEVLVDVIYTPIWKYYWFKMPYLFSLFMHILILLTLVLFKTTLINLIAYTFHKNNIEV